MNIQTKYKPTNLNDFIFYDNRLKNKIDQYVNHNETRPLILHGSFGTGKSLLASLLPDAIEGVTNAKVNNVNSTLISNVTAVNKIFNKKNQYDKMFTENDKFNYYIIEELNVDLKTASLLRQVFEESEGTDLVIITTNNLHSIDGGIVDRASVVEVKPLKPDMFINEAMSIFKAEGKTVDRNKLLKRLVNIYDARPSNRQFYKLLQELIG